MLGQAGDCTTSCGPASSTRSGLCIRQQSDSLDDALRLQRSRIPPPPPHRPATAGHCARVRHRKRVDVILELCGGSGG
jgi:hypothetical protein